jgi:hypothetical protein
MPNIQISKWIALRRRVRIFIIRLHHRVSRIAKPVRIANKQMYPTLRTSINVLFIPTSSGRMPRRRSNVI